MEVHERSNELEKSIREAPAATSAQERAAHEPDEDASWRTAARRRKKGTGAMPTGAQNRAPRTAVDEGTKSRPTGREAKEKSEQELLHSQRVRLG